MSYSYSEVVNAVLEECSKINLTYSQEGDGRITSAIKENEYLSLLEQGLKERHPTFKFEKQPKDRWWWDFRVNGIPFNLKLTTGGTDNAFNKVAILYSLSGEEMEKKNMNFNQFYRLLKESARKNERDRSTEYHYLVVNKGDGKVLLKSILDIHTFKPNPCNDLQINWKNEFNNIEYRTPDDKFKEKMNELLKVVQTSIKQAISSMNEFASADIDADFST